MMGVFTIEKSIFEQMGGTYETQGPLYRPLAGR
jgi:hypothetical protein